MCSLLPHWLFPSNPNHVPVSRSSKTKQKTCSLTPRSLLAHDLLLPYLAEFLTRVAFLLPTAMWLSSPSQRCLPPADSDATHHAAGSPLGRSSPPHRRRPGSASRARDHGHGRWADTWGHRPRTPGLPHTAELGTEESSLVTVARGHQDPTAAGE